MSAAQMLYCRSVRTTATLCLLALVLLVAGCMMPNREKQVAVNEKKLADEGYRQLEVGKPAPPVDVNAVDGSVILSSVEAPTGPVLLFFVTAPDTPNSAKEAHILNAAASELANSGVTAAVVLGVGAERAKAYGQQECPDLKVVADPDLSVSIAYGCAVAGVEFLQRTEVGVAADGTVAFFERGFPFRTAKAMLNGFGIAAPDSSSNSK